MLKSLAVFLQQALSIAGDRSSSNSSWYMSSAFASARAHKTFDALFEPSLASGSSKVVWKPEATASEEQSVGTFPLIDPGVDDGFSLQELSGLQSVVSTESGSSSTRLKHVSVCFTSRTLSCIHSSVHSVWLIPCILSSPPPSSIALQRHSVSIRQTRWNSSR